MDLKETATWSSAFGLATTPLFEREQSGASTDHTVMLDGGHGSFALSVVENDQTDPKLAADWIWSANLPHHVEVGSETVRVIRWDAPQRSRQFSIPSVRDRFDSFYDFLVSDRIASNRTVVDYLIGIFRSIRSVVHAHGDQASSPLELFLSLLYERTLAQDKSASVSSLAAPVEERSLSRLAELRHSGFDLGFDRFNETLQQHNLLSPLAVRHAGGSIFQEAHFELLNSPRADMFGYVPPADVRVSTRGGVHFTPPSLARSICEQAIMQIEDLHSRKELRILDPACGSGAFLHETIRTLARLGFKGRLVVEGRDISAHAIAMAKFTLWRSALDWPNPAELTFNIQQEDTLKAELPKADLVLMNPPFLSVGSLSLEQEEMVSSILGTLKQGRPDLSMAFVLKGMEALNDGGALGCLMPASLLESRTAQAWRERLLQDSSIKLIGSFGDHSLFAYALIQVAALVLKKTRTTNEPTICLWSSNKREATGKALRELRRLKDLPSEEEISSSEWRLSSVSNNRLKKLPNWRIRSPGFDAFINELLRTTCFPADNLFDIRQGIATGSNEAFLLNSDEFASLPIKEQRFFLPAVVSDSIHNGKIDISYYVFYPYISGKIFPDNETDLKKVLPTYFNRKLGPLEKDLRGRSSITRQPSRRWWDLAERRAWTDRNEPLIISKHFGALGSFAPNVSAKVGVVQCYAWFLSAAVKEQIAGSPIREEDLLLAYSALFNSSPFFRLVSEMSPTVAGGQFNLSIRYVRSLPIPNIAINADTADGAELFDRLVNLGKSVSPDDPEWLAQANVAAERAYGYPSSTWPS